MITFSKINNTHFNVYDNGTVVLSGGLNTFVVSRRGNKATLMSVEGNVRYDVYFENTVASDLNELMDIIADVMFDGYTPPTIAGDAIVYDSGACYSASSDLVTIDLVALKGALTVATRNVFDKVAVEYKIDDGIVASQTVIEITEVPTLWDDAAKALTYIDYTP